MPSLEIGLEALNSHSHSQFNSARFSIRISLQCNRLNCKLNAGHTPAWSASQTRIPKGHSQLIVDLQLGGERQSS